VRVSNYSILNPDLSLLHIRPIKTITDGFVSDEAVRTVIDFIRQLIHFCATAVAKIYSALKVADLVGDVR
jgi:hypothetical protein